MARVRPLEKIDDSNIPYNLLDEPEHRGRSSEGLVDWSNDRSSGDLGLRRHPWNCQRISGLRSKRAATGDTIRDVVSRLQSEGVKITHDVLAAIVATIAMTEEIVG